MTPDEAEAHRIKLEAKPSHANIRRTLHFAGVYQIVHELLKEQVIGRVRQFYWRGFADGRDLFDEEGYARAVGGAGKMRGSLDWLVGGGAINQAQADRLDAVYEYRHVVTHELIKFIVDPDFDVDYELLVDALTILRAISRFWVGIEAGVGTFEDFEDLDLDEVTPLWAAVLGICLDAIEDPDPA